MKKYLFTITQGRTGTHYFSHFLQNNVPNIKSHQELIAFGSYGVDTPGTSVLTHFNAKGNTPLVKRFWRQKLSRIARRDDPFYAETSHVLAKAGLMENLSYLGKDAQIFIVILKRDVKKILTSLVVRNDMLSVADRLVWFLMPIYPKNILESMQFSLQGLDGQRLWYIYEMSARAEYYKIKFRNKKNIKFIDLDITQLNTPKSSQKFLNEIGVKKNLQDIVFTEPSNTSTRDVNIPKEIKKRVNKVIQLIYCDPKMCAKNHIKLDKSFN